MSDNKEGPFEVVESLDSLMIRSWSSKLVHNPTIKKYKNKYYLYHIGTTYSGDIPLIPEEMGSAFSVINHPARYNKKIGGAVAYDLEWPFLTSESNQVLDKRNGEWDSTFVSNPSILMDANGIVKMSYKS